MKETICFKLNKDDDEKLDKLVKEYGTTKSTLLRNIVISFLEVNNDEY